MFNFGFFNPTRIVFGRDTIAGLAGLVPAGSRVLVCYGGGSIKANGVHAQVMAGLSGFAVAEFGGIEPNPQTATCERAVAAVRSHRADFLLAVGGGSVADAVKLIAASAATPGVPAWDLVLDSSRIKAALPFGVVLTLPATGSEMNTNSVISRVDPIDKRGWSSPLVHPVFSILDPATTFSLPPRQVANGIVDTWVHVCEQYLTTDSGSPVQDRFAESLLLTLREAGPRAMLTPKDYELRANLMWAATMALNGLIGAGVVQDWATHGIGHELTALYGLDHGRSLAVVLPGVLRLCRKHKRDKLLRYAREVWGLHQGDEDVLIDEAIGRTVLFFESLGVPTTLRGYGIPAEAADLVAARIAEKGGRLGENQDIGPEEVRHILAGQAG
jgi:NADP-dependent alcohol dehydrogenase